MSLLDTVKDAVLGRAMKLISDPRLTRLATDPRVMSAAMKAVEAGTNLKGKLDQAGRMAGGMFGLVSKEEVSNLRGTIQTLEDQIGILESRAAAAEAEAEALRSQLAQTGAQGDSHDGDGADPSDTTATGTAKKKAAARKRAGA